MHLQDNLGHIGKVRICPSGKVFLHDVAVSQDGLSQNMAYHIQVVPSSGEAQELLAKIQRTHLGYLQLDENNEKLKTRREVEDLIASHLSTVPHKEKFPCPKFLEILRRSIDDKSDFNGCKAVRAFDALVKYAVNLISQPWRQEYRCIRLYSGFFKHTVDRHLSNAREVLYLMGYDPADKTELKLNEPVDPDRVIDVSLNCLIAAVECQIMMQIMERTGGSFSWREIAYIRRHNTCSALKAAQLLKAADKRNNKLHQEKNNNNAGGGGKSVADSRRGVHKNNGYVKVEKLVDIPSSWIDSADLMEADERYPTSPAYGSTWEKKYVANGYNNLDCGSDLLPKTLDEHIAASYGGLVDDYSVKPARRNESLTREDCWGFVDQTLDKKAHHHRDYNERSDFLKGGGFQTVIVPEASYVEPLKQRDDVRLSPWTTSIPLSTINHGGTHKRQKLPAEDIYGGSTFHETASRDLADSWRRPSPQIHSYAVPSTISHPNNLAAVDNLINLESAYVNVCNPLYFPSTVIMPRPVTYRTSVPYYSNPLMPLQPQVYEAQIPPMVTSVAGIPLDIPPLDTKVTPRIQDTRHSSRTPGTYDTPSVCDALNSLKIAERETSAKKSHQAANRSSWYDNVSSKDFPPPPNLIDVDKPTTTTLGADHHHLLPPPTPFRSDPPLVTSSVAPTTPSFYQPSHRRRASDGIADIHTITVVDGSGGNSGSRPAISERQEKSNSFEKPSSRKSSISSTERWQTDKAASGAQGRKGSASMSRHERSPSAGSIQQTSSTVSLATTTTPYNKWSCWACTFLNRPEKEICEMCSRSRHRGAESDPLASGGHECQQCTLVNEKGAHKCIACGLSLENSPTYV